MKFLKYLVLFVSLFYVSEVKAEAYIVDTPVLNVRSCASTNCKIIGKIKSGEHVNSIKDHGEWIEIEREKGTGFVIKNALVEDLAAGIDILCVIAVILAIFVIWFIYMLPAKIAKNNKNANKIYMVNLFLGWFPIIWLILLICALTGEHSEEHHKEKTIKFGVCCYCGKKIKFYKKYHKECHDKFLLGNEKILSITKLMIHNDFDFNKYNDILEDCQQNYYINDEVKRNLLIKSWEDTITKVLEDSYITEKLEKHLLLFSEKYKLSQDELDKNKKFEELIKASVIRKLSSGIIPELKYTGILPFNFQKDEKIVWVFQDVEYSEIKERTRYEGGSIGGSFRVAKGVYFRTGSFRGHPVHYNSTEYIGNGTLVVTNKHLYFGCQYQNFRIKYEKIVSLTPYSDGIGIQRDAITAKPQIFKIEDGWFVYNVLVNISKINN